MAVAPVTVRYSRGLRPALPESLGEHTDREFRKIEIAVDSLIDRITKIEARLAAASIP